MDRLLQIFLIFILALIVAYLVGMGVEFSTKEKLSKMGMLELSPKVNGSDEKSESVIDFEKDIETFRQLGGPDVLADEAAIEEFADRLMAQLENIDLDDLQKIEYAAKINDIKKLLTSNKEDNAE